MVIKNNIMSKIFIGIDFGGTNIKVGCFDNDIKLIAKASTPTEAEMGPESVVDRIIETTKTLLTKAGTNTEAITAIGIGTPGPADYKKGIIYQCTNMPKFKDTPLRDMIAAGLGAPAILENDANAACWGEFVIGAGEGIGDMVFFTLGTGIGGGIVSDGELVRGNDGNAAELGHIIIHPDGRLCGCGQRGCVEAYASASSTAKRATEAVRAERRETSLKKVLNKTGQITCKNVFDHSAAGDELAGEITETTAKALGILCVNMLHATGAQRIVFAGGMIAAGDMLLNRIRHYFTEHIWQVKPESVEICFAALGRDAGIKGTAALAKHAKEQGKLA